MEENFIFLTRISGFEYELICQRLKEAGIKYQIKSPPEAGIMGAIPQTKPTEVYVLTSDLENAKDLLGIKKQGFSFTGLRSLSMIKITIIILLVGFLFFILGNYLNSLF